MKTQDYVKMEQRLREAEAEVARLRELHDQRDYLQRKAGDKFIEITKQLDEARAAAHLFLCHVIDRMPTNTTEAEEYLKRQTERWPWLEDADDGTD